MSLTHRLLALTLVASLPGLAALSYNAVDLRNARYDEVRAQSLRNTNLAVAELDQIFDGLSSTLLAVSQASEVRSGTPEICRAYLSRVRQGVEALISIVVANRDGTIRCLSESESSPANLADRRYFQDIFRTGNFSVGDFTASRISQQNIVPVALPLRNGGAIDGAVMAGLNLEWFGRQIRERGVPAGGSLTVLDRNGIVVAREPYPERFVGKRARDSSVELLNAPSPGTRELLSADGTQRIVGFVPAGLTSFGFFVSTGISRDAAFGPIDAAVWRSLALFGLGALLALTLAWLIGESIIRRPLMRLVETANAWRAGNDSVRTNIVDRGDEIGLLGQTFDRLMDESARRADERQTAENRREILVHELAHRVKNTLATVQSIAMLSFRHSQGPEALRGFQDRLQALVRSHDLLTARNWEHADLSEVVAVALAPLKGDLGDRFVAEGTSVDLPPTTAVPVAMILHELSTNALKYGALASAQGRVAISWATTPDTRGVRIDMTWQESGGPAVQPPDRAGFGSYLITNLTRQMHGTYETSYPSTGFACVVRLVTPRYEPRINPVADAIAPI